MNFPKVRLEGVVAIDRDQRLWKDRPYVGLENIEGGSGRLLGDRSVTGVKSTSFGFDDRHVLYGRLRPYLNKVLLPDFTGHCSTEIFPLLPAANLDRRYLWYWLTRSNTVDEINATCTGTRMPRANMDRVLGFEIPLPPLDEQQRIVRLLDRTFAAIAAATTNVEKSLTNARKMLEAVISSAFKEIGGPRRKLLDACERVTVGHVGTTSPHYRENGIPFLRTQNLGKTGIELNDLVYITPEFHRSLGKSTLRTGDVLISRVVTDRMNVGVVPPTLGEANCANVICVRPGADMDPRFLMYLIQADQSQRELLGRRKGSAQQVVNTTELKNWHVPVPRLDQQLQVVERLDALTGVADDLRSTYVSKIALLEALKQSLLNRAFSGEPLGAQLLAA